MIQVNEERLEQLMNLFFEFIEDHGWTAFIETYHEHKTTINRKKLLLPEQILIVRDHLTCIFNNIPATISLSLSRQIGKSEIIGLIDAFCFVYYQEITGDPYTVMVLAPEKNTGTVIFDRICRYLPDKFWNEKDKSTQKTRKTGDWLEIFSLYDDNSGSIAEGRTAKRIIRDEAHTGSDKKFIDEVLPVQIRTSGVTTLIGNGGYRDCYFYQRLISGNTFDETSGLHSIVHKYPYSHLKKTQKKLAEAGVVEASKWIKGIERIIRESGVNSIETRKNINCEWMLTSQSYLLAEDIDKCLDKVDKSSDLVLSIDFAKHQDRTIAIVGNANFAIFDIIILKDSGERRDIFEQLSELRDICDERGYTERIVSICGDATGLGEAAVEQLEVEMEMPVYPFKFTIQSKHKSYTEMQSRIITQDPNKRLKIDIDTPHYDLLRSELSELQVKEAMNGEYLRFFAPERDGYHDDTVAALALYAHMCGREFEFTRNNKPRAERFYEETKENQTEILKQTFSKKTIKDFKKEKPKNIMGSWASGY